MKTKQSTIVSLSDKAFAVAFACLVLGLMFKLMSFLAI